MSTDVTACTFAFASSPTGTVENVRNDSRLIHNETHPCYRRVGQFGWSVSKTDSKPTDSTKLIFGCSGLEADQKVIAAHGCYAMTATSALTAQNTQGVYGIHETPSNFVQKQVEACVDDIGVDAVKTGSSQVLSALV